MNALAKMLIVLGFCGLAACAHRPLGTPSPHAVTLSWSPVATNDVGRSVSEPITYNVYASPGAGPIPTKVSRSCGVTTVAEGPPLNSEPIAATTYSTSVAAGLWTFAVEAVSSDGCRSALSSPVTITVPVRDDSATNGVVGP